MPSFSCRSRYASGDGDPGQYGPKARSSTPVGAREWPKSSSICEFSTRTLRIVGIAPGFAEKQDEMLTIGKVPLFGSELLGLHDANSARISMQRLGKSFTSTEKPHWQRHHWSTRPNWLWASLLTTSERSLPRWPRWPRAEARSRSLINTACSRHRQLKSPVLSYLYLSLGWHPLVHWRKLFLQQLLVAKYNYPWIQLQFLLHAAGSQPYRLRSLSLMYGMGI